MSRISVALSATSTVTLIGIVAYIGAVFVSAFGVMVIFIIASFFVFILIMVGIIAISISRSAFAYKFQKFNTN